MSSSIFLGMLLSKTSSNIEESVYISCGKVTSFPKVAERIMSVFVKRKIKSLLNQNGLPKNSERICLQ